MISVHGLTKTFSGVQALSGIDLEIPAGQVFALLGPNGAGKTTLVRILSTLDRPTSGTASVAGHDVVRAPRQVRSAISLTGQYAAVDELLTGAENLRLMARLWRVPRFKAGPSLERFDLAEAADRRVKTYSGGMRRRLDLAISLLARPSVIFLDEPTTGLDPRGRAGVWDIVSTLAADGVTVFLTTQYLEEADKLASRVAVIDHGRIVADGTPASLKARVPGGHLSLTFTGQHELSAAQAAINGTWPTTVRQTELTLEVATDGSFGEVKEIFSRVNGVAELSLSKPTLDDVFLQLTSVGGPDA